MGETLRGVVKWFNDAKGFGFIEHSSGRDVFVHYSVIEWDGFKTLKDGEEVNYELKEGEKGLHASRVSRPNVAKKKDDNAPDGSEEAVVQQTVEVNAVGNNSSQSAASMIEVEQTEPSEASSIQVHTAPDTASESAKIER